MACYANELIDEYDCMDLDIGWCNGMSFMLIKNH